jgi:hypothetical protein
MQDSPDYSGMTVNERLFVAGLLDKFDEAARQRDRQQLVEILKLVQMTPAEAESSVDALLENPRKYGY